MILGTGLGGVGTLVDGITANVLRGPDRISPFLIPMGIPNTGAGQIAINFGMTGPNFTTVSACATGGHAIGESSETIRRGDADVMIAGGAEAGIYEPMVGGFASMRALSTRNDDPEGASRPFDKGRDGFVIGEGCGVRRPRGARRTQRHGARPSWPSSIGYGATADASHITLPAPGGIGAVKAARRALEKAGIDADEIDHVNAHATSTPEGDKAELQAIRTIFGEHAGERLDHRQQVDGRAHPRARPARSRRSSRSWRMRDGCVPPTINLDDPDPDGRGPRPDAERRSAPGRCGPRSATPSGSAARTPPCLPAVGRMTDEPGRIHGAAMAGGGGGRGAAVAEPEVVDRPRRRRSAPMPTCSR